MTNKQVAEILREVAAAYTIKKFNRFRIIAYEKAADSIEHLSQDIQDIWAEGNLEEIPGVGKEIASHLSELFSKGKSSSIEEAKTDLPKAMFTLLKLPGFGAKKSYKLAKLLNIKDSQNALEILESAAKEHKIASFEGFGEKSEEDVIESIEGFRKKDAKLTRTFLHVAYETAGNMLKYLSKNENVIDALPLGSLRRMTTTIGDVDIAVSTNKPADVLNYFTKYPYQKKIIEKGTRTSSLILTNGVQVDLMVQPPQSFGSLLQHFTGSKAHNIKLREYALKKKLSLSEYGIKKTANSQTELITFSSEEKFYEYLGLQWIPPEMREDTGEIETAAANKLPPLVETKDIKGDLHIHSNYDLEPSHDLGENSFEELILKAKNLGYDYIAFSEHNPSQSGHTESDIITILKKRKQKIDEINYSNKFTQLKVFNMMEVDILPNGNLALPASALEYLDAMIISLHSAFKQDKDTITKRILKALSYPKVKVFGHPTGRLVQRRDGVDADWNAVFKYCKEKNIALEINSSPFRLDLPDTLVRKALEAGNKFVISTDTHRISEMDYMKYGVAAARRGWAKKDDIVNTLAYNKFRSWLLEK